MPTRVSETKMVTITAIVIDTLRLQAVAELGEDVGQLHGVSRVPVVAQCW